MSEQVKCLLCGEPMPEGEEMFNYHGYSGPCPKPPLPASDAKAGAGPLVGSKVFLEGTVEGVYVWGVVARLRSGEVLRMDNQNLAAARAVVGQGSEQQIDELAKFIMTHIKGEPSRDEGAVECACRLLWDAYCVRPKPTVGQGSEGAARIVNQEGSGNATGANSAEQPRDALLKLRELSEKATQQCFGISSLCRPSIEDAAFANMCVNYVRSTALAPASEQKGKP